MVTGFIEFDYETIDGQILDIKGEVIKDDVKFQAFDKKGNVINKKTLSTLDLDNIYDLIHAHAEDEIEFESDFYDRYDN